MVPTNVFAFTPIAGFEIVLFKGNCADQSNDAQMGSVTAARFAYLLM